MNSGVHLWWLLLSVISALNISAWVFSYIKVTRRKTRLSPDVYTRRRWLLWLSAVYVLVCAFRSFLPRIDLERICLVESWLSSMLVGRALTTVAEIFFILQCAILLREAGSAARLNSVMIVSGLLVPTIVVAESFSWYAMLTTNYFGSVVEESLWAVAGMIVVMSFFVLWPRVNKLQRYFITAMLLYGAGFVAFMVTVDVPMYWVRWQADMANGVTHLTLIEGLRDAARLCRVSFAWDVWREEIPWMTLYFTVTVWVSMAMVHAPDFKHGLSKNSNQ